ncbi:MAG: L-aspartate oxidase [Gammaproteobacteria bacterium]|nr:L-aspartate oxidase [Gammaproteobacteria bacterium]
MADQYHHDVLIIGAGAAGLTAALRLADHCRVAVLAKGPLKEGSTLYAQGGISAVLDGDDTIESHIEDTLRAGAGLCDQAAVRHTATHGKQAVEWLVKQGVMFTRKDDDSDYHLTREGGHSHRRVAHADDATGRAIETSLEARARAHANIDLFEHHIVVDLITGKKVQQNHGNCLGAYVLDKDQQVVQVFRARNVILATGGASKVYLYTSNPDVSTGDGVALAWRAGCRVANMEFIQFHPTCLYHPKAKSFLITEAIRGEGGKLRLPNGKPFMHKYDAQGELAPRDIVARAIDHEMKRVGVDYVLLDISYKSTEFIQGHFPNIYQRCLEFGYDMTKEALPVVPAAHYTCGGVVADLHGRTDIAGLYAIGEVAYSGLHGANRLASNSLLECIVFGFAAADDIVQNLQHRPMPAPLPEWDESQVTDSDEEISIAHNWDELRRCMWDYVGIVRSNKRLQWAQRRVDLIKQEVADYYGNFRVTNDLLELRNLLLVAELIIRCARERKESRGLHYTLDYLDTDPAQACPTILTPDQT